MISYKLWKLIEKEIGNIFIINIISRNIINIDLSPTFGISEWKACLAPQESCCIVIHKSCATQTSDKIFFFTWPLSGIFLVGLISGLSAQWAKSLKKAVCRSVLHCIFSAELMKTHSFRLFFLAILLTV